jgi:OCT family organic cation transporter-like MFS transporter 18
LVILTTYTAANIGFDASGTLKVFDFDLARVLPAGRDKLFQLTRNVGSPRYMAPEVRCGGKYNLSADVYSFGILLYHLLTLKKPYSSLERDWSSTNKAIPTIWSSELREVLQDCLSAETSARPHIDKVKVMLEAEVKGEANGETAGEQDDDNALMTAASDDKDCSELLPAASSSLQDSESRSPCDTNATNTILWITYLNIVLYALCYQLQSPVEPFLVKSLIDKNANSASDDSSLNVSRTYGNLQSFFQAMQTIGSPLVGILLDRLGIQKTSALVFLASALSYAILAMATDLTGLFYSKIPTVLQAAFLVAQATATTALQADSSHTASTMAAARAAALGRMTTAYTIGATLGPTIGGNLADHGDYSIGAKLAVAGSLVSVLLSLWFLPNTAKKQPKSQENKKVAEAERSFLQELKHSGKLLVRSGLWPLLMIKVLGGVIASMHSTAVPLIMTKELGLEPSQLGLVMSSCMFAVAAIGAFAMAPLTQLLHSSRLFGMIQLGLLLRALMGCGLAWIVSAMLPEDYRLLYSVIGVSICHALASHTLATGLTTQTTGMVSKEELGSLLGLEHGLFSLARIIGPTLGTRLLEWKGLWSVEITCGLVDVLLATLAMVLLAQGKQKSL